MSVDYEKAQAIFLEAVERSNPDDQSQYLDEACGDDRKLRQHLEILLNAHGQSGSFLEKGALAASPTLDQPITEKPGTLIGPYKRLQQLGEGGMGVVYMAEQHEPVRRKVALKIIKPGMDTRQVIARFEAERQALSLMDHPNIAKVLDAGTTGTGRPYFVMELVKGQPITEYCDQQHLTPRQRLELFLSVCQAIQHAHQKGIIHRDVKPSNVLVAEYDGRPVAKVIDFGVAKAVSQPLTERTMFTGFGQVVGTLEYMSPEQARVNQLDVDTRSDIYSLGVLLYELLTGNTPFDKQRLRSAAWDEMLRIIREEEPPRPSTRLSESKDSLPSISAQRKTEPAKLTKLVRGELDWIVMKALEKDRSRRYETASALAADLQRYLDDEPVVACPPSATYRFLKFVRRNRSGLMAGGVLAAACLVAVAGIGWAIRDRAAVQQKVAQDQELRRSRNRSQIELLLDDVERHALRYDWQRASESLRQADVLLRTSDPIDDLSERAQQQRRDLKLIERLEDVRLKMSDTKDGGWTLENAISEYATVFREYGLNLEELSAAAAAARIRARPGLESAVVPSLDDWATMARTLGKADGPPLFELLRLLDPDPWRQQVRNAAARKDAGTLKELAAHQDLEKQPVPTLVRLALSLAEVNEQTATISVLRIAQRKDPSDFWSNHFLGTFLGESSVESLSFMRAAVALRPESAMAVHNLACALDGLGLKEDALELFQQSVELDPGFSWAHNNLGNTLLQLGRHQEAEVAVRKAIAISPDCARYHLVLGDVLDEQQRFDEATASHRKAIELDPKLASAYTDLGVALYHQRNLEEAIASYRKAIELDPKIAKAHDNLGVALRDQGKLDEAIASHRKAIELNPKLATAFSNLGAALYDQRNVEDAIASFRKAIELDPKIAKAHNDLGTALYHQGQLEEAIASYRKAIELDPKFANAHDNLGLALRDQGKLDEAIASHRKAIELGPKIATAYDNLGNILRDQGKLDEAIASHRKAIELDPKIATAFNNLGIALYHQRKLEEAIASYRKAIERDPKIADAYNNLGLALLDQGHLEEAIVSYRKAIELNPKCADAYNNLGLVLRDQGQLEEAIASYRKAIALNPKLADAYNNLGIALRDQGNLEEAIASCRKAIELNPKLAIAYNTLGAALYGQRNLEDAIASFRKAIELDPKYTNAYINLGEVLFANGQFEESIGPLRHLVELNPNIADFHNALGRAYCEAGNAESGIREFRRAMELATDSAPVQFNLCVALIKAGDYATAFTELRALVERQPALPAAVNLLAWHLAVCPVKDLRQPAEAVTRARRLVELAPNAGEFWDTLGVAQYRAGDWKAARDALNRAIELGVDLASTRLFLAMAEQRLGDEAEARSDYQRAVRWMEEHAAELPRGSNQAEELRRFRAEADELLLPKKE